MATKTASQIFPLAPSVKEKASPSSHLGSGGGAFAHAHCNRDLYFCFRLLERLFVADQFDLVAHL